MEGGSEPEDGSDADTGHRIDEFLGEFRMVIPALGAILGFQLTVAFSQGFQDLAERDQAVNFAGVTASAVAIIFLLVPASYHRFSPNLEQSARFIRYAQHNIGWAFLFIPVSLACSLYVQGMRTFGRLDWAASAALLFLAAALVLWWLLPWRRALRRPRGENRSTS